MNAGKRVKVFASLREEQESWFKSHKFESPLEKKWRCDICDKAFTQVCSTIS